MDSGAYSAFTQKKVINIKEYTKFCLNNSSHITNVVNLDVIKPHDPNIAAEEGRNNFLYMRDEGVVDVFPVWHARENFKWLDYMIDECPYVGLSFTSLVSPIEARAGSRIVWNYITNRDGYPVVKTHSFGDTSERTLLTQPFTSADSATWMIQGGRAARIKLQGKSYQLRSNSIGDTNFILDSDTGPKRESWEQEITTLGLDPNAVMKVKAKGSELAMIRSFLVASDLLNLQDQTTEIKKYRRSPSLIQSPKYINSQGIVRSGPVNVYFVISPSAYYFNYPVIQALGIKNILVSYYYVATAPKNFWEEKVIPFIQDPDGFFEIDPQAKKFRDKLGEVLLKSKGELAYS